MVEYSVGQRIILTSYAAGGGIAAISGVFAQFLNTKVITEDGTFYVLGQHTYEHPDVLFVPVFGGFIFMFLAAYLSIHWFIKANENAN